MATRFAMALLLVIALASVERSSQLMASDGDGGSADEAARPAVLKSASASVAAPDLPFTEFDSEAERQLLDLANRARAQAGLHPLDLDSGLSKAAHMHAQEMFTARQISHQFSGEPSLPQRLAATAATRLDREGENVALDFDAANAQQHLMLSPHHRENLLNPQYNVIGLGVVRSGGHLYIVQDFGHALPNYSLAEVKEHVLAAVAQLRRQANQPALEQLELPAADDAACSMPKADRLGTSTVHQLAQRYKVLTYTSLRPETLPENAGRVLASHNLRSFSFGACYARTGNYPNGVYWVVLALD